MAIQYFAYTLSNGDVVYAGPHEELEGVRILGVTRGNGRFMDLSGGYTHVVGSIPKRGPGMYWEVHKLVKSPIEPRVGEHLATENQGSSGASLDTIVFIETIDSIPST